MVGLRVPDGWGQVIPTDASLKYHFPLIMKFAPVAYF